MQQDLVGWHSVHVATSVLRLRSTASTQLEARHRIAAGTGDGLAVLADEQAAGRGRFGRAWHSPPGNLYLSLVLRPPQPLSFWPQYTMLAALAVASALEAVPAVPVTLKWPNDVLLAGRKVAGILAEVSGPYLILGIGVNVNAALPAEVANATSLCAASGRPVELAGVTRLVIEAIDAGCAHALRGATFDRAWAARLATLGQMVTVTTGQRIVAGVAERVTSEGGLVLRRPDGSRETFLAGDVSLNPVTPAR